MAAKISDVKRKFTNILQLIGWIWNSLHCDPLTHDRRRGANIALECCVQQRKGSETTEKVSQRHLFLAKLRLCADNQTFFCQISLYKKKNTPTGVIFEDPPAPRATRVHDGWMWLNMFIQYQFERFLLNQKIDGNTGDKLQILVWLTWLCSLNEKALRKKKTKTST